MIFVGKYFSHKHKISEHKSARPVFTEIETHTNKLCSGYTEPKYPASRLDFEYILQ